jgi:Ca2+-binding RTX toxin-like protein
VAVAGVEATLDGGPGDDVLEGDGPNVTADFSRSPSAEIVDLVAETATGGDGNDTLLNIANIVGTPFGDTLVGNDKPNKVTGGGGTDTVATLQGADTIDVRDGGPDTVACGTETDSVIADRRSADQVNADCENVDALPEPPAPPPSTTTSPTTTTGPGSTAFGAQPGGPNDTMLLFSLRAARAQRVLRQKGLVLKVRCPDESCTAIVGTTGSLRGLRSGIRPATSQVAAGVTKTLRVRLTRKQLRLLRTALRHHKHAILTLTVDGVDASGNVVTRTVRVRVER